MTNETDNKDYENQDFIEITDQGPDADFEGVEDLAKSTAWSAEFWGPDEKTEDPEVMATFGMVIKYHNGDPQEWFYPEISVAVQNKSVREFAHSKGFTDIGDNDVEELEAFLFHYVRFMRFDVEVPNQEFEAKDVIETIGDDLLDEFDSEYTQLGQPAVKEDVKRTLH